MGWSVTQQYRAGGGINIFRFPPEMIGHIDTHGEKIIKKVWNLLDYTLGVVDVPVMIERDNNIPPLKALIKEYKKLDSIIRKRS